MPTLLVILDKLIFSGVPSNATWDLIKMAWSRANNRAWEDLYLDAFQSVLDEERSRLMKYAGDDGEISLNRQDLARLLHYDLGANVDSMTLSSLSNEQFENSLAEEIAKQETLIIGGHTLTKGDYASVIRRLVQNATARFRQSVIQNKEAFQKELIIQAIDNREILAEIASFLEIHLETKLDLLLERSLEQARQHQELSSQLTNMRRDFAGVSQAIAEGLSSRLTSYGAVPFDTVTSPDAPPYRPTIFVQRDTATKAFVGDFSSGTIWLALSDGPGTGKTQTAKSIVEISAVRFSCWISLRGRREPRAYVHAHLALWLSNLTSNPNNLSLFIGGKQTLVDVAKQIASLVQDEGILVIDDLPDPQGNPTLYEALGQICAQFIPYRTKLITTGHWPIPPNLVADLPVRVTQIPPFTTADILTLLEQAGAPRSLQSSSVGEFIRTGTSGVPSLVAATIRWLRAQDWRLNKDDFLAIIQGIPSQEARRTNRERIISFLSNDQKRLLYRLSFLWHPFDVPLALSIASLAPSVEFAGECFESLINPWLEHLSNGKYQVTPVLKESGKSNIDDETVKQIYLAAVDEFLSRDSINVSDVATIAGYYFAAGDYEGFLSFLIQIMTHARTVERARYLDAAAFVTQLLPPGQAWPANVSRKLKIFFRTNQIRIGVLAGHDPASLDADLQGLLAVEPEDDDEALPMFLACAETSVMLGFLEPIDALQRAFHALRLMYSWGLDTLVDSQTHEVSVSGDDGSLQFEDMIWSVVFRLESIEEIDFLMQKVQQLPAHQQQRLLQSSWAAEAFSITVDRLWMKESERSIETRTWQNVLSLLDTIGRIAELTHSSMLNVAQARARSIILADYLDEFDGAISTLERVSVEDDPDLVVLKHYTLANIYFDANELSDAARNYSAVVAADTAAFGYYRLSAQKHLAVIHGKQGNLREAKAACVAALHRIGVRFDPDDLRLYDRLEMLGELAWVNWASVCPKKTCGAMYGLVMELTKRGNDSEARYRELYNKAGHALGWFVPIASSGRAVDLTSDGLPYVPVEAGFMGQMRKSLQNFQGPSEYSKALLASQIGFFAEAIGLDRLAWKAFYHADAMLQENENWYLSLSSIPLVAPLAARFGTFDEAMRLGIQTIRAFSVGQHVGSGGDFKQHADYVLQQWNGLSDAAKQQAERRLTYLVFGPGFVEHLKWGLELSGTTDRLRSARDSIHRYHDSLVEPDFWYVVLEFLERLVELHANNSKDIGDLAVPGDEPLLKAMQYLTWSEMASTRLADSLRMQVYSLEFVFKLRDLGRPMHRPLGEFLHRHWQGIAYTKGFALRNPQLVRKAIDETPPDLGVETISAVLRIACSAVGTVLPSAISAQFDQALAASKRWI